MWARFSFWKKRVMYSPGDALVDQALICERLPRQQQAVAGRKRNPIIEHPLLIPGSRRAGPKGGVHTWVSQRESPHGRHAIHPLGEGRIPTLEETDQLPPNNLFLPLLHFILLYSLTPLPASSLWSLERCPGISADALHHTHPPLPSSNSAEAMAISSRQSSRWGTVSGSHFDVRVNLDSEVDLLVVKILWGKN